MKIFVTTLVLTLLLNISVRAYERDWEIYPHDSVLTMTTYSPAGISDDRTELDSSIKYIYTFNDTTNTYTTTCYAYHSTEKVWYKQWIDSVVYNEQSNAYQQSFYTLNYMGDGNITGKKVTTYNDLTLATSIDYYGYDSATESYFISRSETIEYDENNRTSRFNHVSYTDTDEAYIHNYSAYEYNDYGDILLHNVYYLNNDDIYELSTQTKYLYTYDGKGNIIRSERCEYRQVSGWNNKYTHDYKYNPDNQMLEDLYYASSGDTLNLEYQHKTVYTYENDTIYELVYSLRNGDTVITEENTTIKFANEESSIINRNYLTSGELWVNYNQKKFNYKDMPYEIVRIHKNDTDSTLVDKQIYYFPLYADTFTIDEDAEIRITFNDTLKVDDDITDNIQIKSGTESSNITLISAYVDSNSPNDIVLQFDRDVTDGELFTVYLTDGVYSYDKRRAQFELTFGNNTTTETAEVTKANEVILFPTVADTETTLRSDTDILNIEIISQTGVCNFKSDNISEKVYNINVEQFSPGVYYVFVTTEAGMQTIRFVVM